VVHWPSAADEHQAHDAGRELGCVGGGLEDALGFALDRELGDGLDDEDGRGCWLGGDDPLDCATQWSAADFAGHLGTAVAETRVSFPDTRHAATVTCRTDAAAEPDCATQWSAADLAGHLGTAVAETRVSFPDTRHAARVTCWTDAAEALGRFAVLGVRPPASAYPPADAATTTTSTTAKGMSLLGFL
jgi:hypothetical protein